MVEGTQNQLKMPSLLVRVRTWRVAIEAVLPCPQKFGNELRRGGTEGGNNAASAVQIPVAVSQVDFGWFSEQDHILNPLVIGIDSVAYVRCPAGRNRNSECHYTANSSRERDERWRWAIFRISGVTRTPGQGSSSSGGCTLPYCCPVHQADAILWGRESSRCLGGGEKPFITNDTLDRMCLFSGWDPALTRNYYSRRKASNREEPMVCLTRQQTVWAAYGMEHPSRPRKNIHEQYMERCRPRSAQSDKVNQVDTLHIATSCEYR